MIHYHFETLASTNDWAKSQLETFAKDKLTVVTTDTQTRGRGQYGRTWISPKGKNLYASFCFFIEQDKYEPLALTRLLALSLARVLEGYGVVCRFKHPNDLLVNGEKIAGILSETIPFPPQLGVIIGVGLNVNMSKEELDQIDQPATSLKNETQKEWDIPKILEELQNTLQTDLIHRL